MEKAYLSSGFAAPGLLYLPIYCNGQMSTALLDFDANHNYIALP